MRCDLHVHTRHSGPCSVPVLSRICRESYTEPETLYELLKRRGMDLVTVTDHDSIDAAESLRRHPDFFLSEEVTCTAPSGTRFHLGVYDIEERDHVELQRRRDDAYALLAWLRERRLPSSINHVFSSLTGRRQEGDFGWFESAFPLVETRNGQMPEGNNREAARLAQRSRGGATGGSDAHTPGSAGLTYTEVAGAESKEDFLRGLRRGETMAKGRAGDYWTLTRAVLEIGGSMMRENPWTMPLAPLALAVPVATLVHSIRERLFLRKWARRLDRPYFDPVLACHPVPAESWPGEGRLGGAGGGEREGAPL
jgi:predicted metal-dependent phosphoesterase TrpH